MTFLAPAFFVAGIAAALVVVGLHFLVTRPPSLLAFPTTRFIPASTIVVTSIARRPQDLLLLLLRVLALLAIGAAFARPVFVPGQRDLARIIILDQSRTVADPRVARDSARAWLHDGDRLVVVDSSARFLSPAALDSLGTLGHGRGSLSAGLILARRAASELQLEADSIELVIVAPFTTDAVDDATLPMRARWPGRIRLVPVPARQDSASTSLQLEAATSDPMRATAALAGKQTESGATVRLIRNGSAIDSAWVRAGGTAVEWPDDARPAGWDSASDTVNAVITSEGAVVFTFPRDAHAPAGSALAVAHWVDGLPAATEIAVGQGCIRQVAIPVTARGDFVLRPDFQRLFRRLTARCDGRSVGAPLSPAILALLAGDGSLASREAIAPPEAPETPLVPWLFALAILLMLAELFLRRRPAIEPALDVPLERAA